jgi:AcrR family transcriptional regulator
MIKTSSPPTPLSPHRQRKHDAMMQKILDAARAIMREQGVAALSIQELARRVDLRAPSLYNYFDGKMDIYDALFRLGFSLYGETVRKYNEGATTWQEFVRRAFESYLTFAKENPELYQLCFERPVPGFVPSEDSMQVSAALLESAYQRMTDLHGTMRTGLPAARAVDLVIALMHGITAMHMANEPDAPLEQGRFGSLIPVAMELLEQAWT